LNVLYIGVDNPVSIAATGGTDEKISVSIEGGGGKIEKSSAGIYNLQVTEITDKCVVSVLVDGKLAGTSTFRVRNLPVPSATVGGYPSGQTITSAALQAQAGVGAYIMDFPFDVRYKIIGYTLMMGDEKGNVKSVDCESAEFSPEAKQYINQHVKPGSIVTIDKIRAKDQGGRILKLPSLVYHIQ
jgi:hypothetical protein